MVEVLLGEFRDVSIDVVSKSQSVDYPVLVDATFAHKTLCHHISKEFRGPRSLPTLAAL